MAPGVGGCREVTGLGRLRGQCPRIMLWAYGTLIAGNSALES